MLIAKDQVIFYITLICVKFNSLEYFSPVLLRTNTNHSATTNLTVAVLLLPQYRSFSSNKWAKIGFKT